MKLLGALLIIASSSFYGIRKSHALKKRIQCLDNIISALGFLKTEIEFSKERLKSALIKADNAFDTCGIFTQCSENLEQGTDVSWQTAVDGAYGIFEEDKRILKRLGTRLGITDITDQKENIICVTELLKENRRSALEIYEKYSRLYSSGGILIGAAIVILLI